MHRLGVRLRHRQDAAVPRRRRGQDPQRVWRVVTWPLANGFDQQLLWVAVSIAVLWYFGSKLEEQVAGGAWPGTW